jgi:hypothetical protein
MDVCSLYLAPPQGAVVLSIDEKTAIAVRSHKHPSRPARPGRAGRQEFEYVRHGTVSIVAALDVRTGEVLTEPIAKNDSITVVGFLQMLNQTIDPCREIHVVMDNGRPTPPSTPGSGWLPTLVGTSTSRPPTPPG